MGVTLFSYADGMSIIYQPDRHSPDDPSACQRSAQT